MSNNIDEIEDEEEDYYPHRHNFSALNYIKIEEPTPEEVEAEKKKQEILDSLSKYEMIFPDMHRLMYQAALIGEDLDREYETLKHLWDFM
jgi:hypothetical protein